MKDIHDVITDAKFGDDRLRGSGVVAGQISAFPIDFAGRPYNTLALPCERVINQERIGMGSSNLVARLVRSHAMNCNYSRSKGQSHVTYQQTKRYNSAVYGHINIKLSGNYRRRGRRVWYTFNVSKSNKPEVEIWRTFKILNAKN